MIEVHVPQEQHNCLKEAAIAESKADIKNIVGWIKSVSGKTDKIDAKMNAILMVYVLQFFAVLYALIKVYSELQRAGVVTG